MTSCTPGCFEVSAEDEDETVWLASVLLAGMDPYDDYTQRQEDERADWLFWALENTLTNMSDKQLINAD